MLYEEQREREQKISLQYLIIDGFTSDRSTLYTGERVGLYLTDLREKTNYMYKLSKTAARADLTRRDPLEDEPAVVRDGTDQHV